MTPWRVLALTLLFGTALAEDNSPADDRTPAAEVTLPVQVDPREDIARLYPQADHIGFAIAIAPDPRVPRYRRLFDLNVQAITLGMLDDGYVLDRYAFPENGGFGIMIFRCDGWRKGPCEDVGNLRPGTEPPQSVATRIRAIYFVNDTATWGVPAQPLICAVQRIRAQLSQDVAGRESCNTLKWDLPRPAVPAELLRYPGGCPAREGQRSLVLLGPTFSGALDSLGQQLGELLGAEITDLCVVSAFTTVGSNHHAMDRYPKLHYARLALEDGVKLLALANMAQSFGYFDPKADNKERRFVPRKVAFLTEASTFGHGVCKSAEGTFGEDRERVMAFCRGAQVLHFPSAIADIRYGLDQQRAKRANEVQVAVDAALPVEHLALDIGAENGSEFPETRQSALTAASQQLALDRVLDKLEQSDPKLVVVVATDVRDRLFLFDQLRERLPSALLVDLETDILLAHPDFLHASRGALTVGSANLFVQWNRLYDCEPREFKQGEIRASVPLASWALDGQGMLADAVSRLDDSDAPLSRPPCIAERPPGSRQPILHVVTLNGLRRVSRAYAPLTTTPMARDSQKRKNGRRIDLVIAQWLGVLASVLVVVPWLTLRPLKRRARNAHLFSREHLIYAAAITAIASWVFAMRAAYSGQDPESGYALIYWSIMLLTLAFCGLLRCWQRVRETGPAAGKLPERYRRTILAFGAVSCVLAAAPAILRCMRDDSHPALDDDLITRLGLDIGQGLAYYVVTSVGVVTLLFTMVVLATAACIMTRNNDLLNISTAANECDLGARVPRFPRFAILANALLILLIAGPYLVSPLGGPRLSVFGPGASAIATLVLVVTTLGASILTTVAIHSSRRIRTMAGDIGRCVSPGQTCKPSEPADEYPGLWPPNGWQPRLFAATPIVVRVNPEIVQDLRRGTRFENGKRRSWKTLIREFLGKCEGTMNVNDWQHRRAIYALLASEISLYRWFVGGAVLCALSSVCTAYLFPLEADTLLMWNLGVLVVHALLAGYVATTFERDGVLSNILCNRPRKVEFSASLFAYAAMPFLALGLAIAVSQVPGVVDWGGGVLKLLTAIGLGL